MEDRMETGDKETNLDGHWKNLNKRCMKARAKAGTLERRGGPGKC